MARTKESASTNSIRIITSREVKSRVGLKDTAFCELRKRDKTFPQPVPLGGQGTKRLGFVEHEVQRWLEVLVAKRDAA